MLSVLLIRYRIRMIIGSRMKIRSYHPDDEIELACHKPFEEGVALAIAAILEAALIVWAFEG